MFRRRSARRNAFEQIARLSANSRPGDEHESDFEKLSNLYPKSSKVSTNGVLNSAESSAISVGTVPMTVREFGVLISLCKAAPLIRDEKRAQRLLDQLSPYLLESCYQALASSSTYREIIPSPWELLTLELTQAVLQLGIQNISLRADAFQALSRYVNNCHLLASSIRRARLESANHDGVLQSDKMLSKTVVFLSSLLGFLKASAACASFWNPDERLELLNSLQTLLSEDLLLSIESALSIIRNTREESVQHLKHYLRQCSSDGRPLGVLLLRQGLTELVEACAALLVLNPDVVKNPGLLPALMSGNNDQEGLQHWNIPLSHKIAQLAEREIVMSDEGSEYLRLESSGQNFRVHAVKASSLRSFLCCALLDEDVADPESLMSWLESTLSDTTQFADETLSCTAIQCMAILAKSSDAIATNLGRSLPRLLVRGPMSPTVATTVANALLVVLRLMSQDSVITTLYGLGNSLTASRNAEGHSAYKIFGESGSDTAEEVIANGHLGPRSTVSLLPSNRDKISRNHNAVILAIVKIARGLKDSKVTALCLSMLIQKVGRGDSAVDLKITTEAAALAFESDPNEFRALLRLYARLSHEGIHQRNEALLTAVLDARVSLSLTLKGGSQQYEIYLRHLLEAIVGEGDSQQMDPERSVDRHHAAQEIALVLRPLAILASANLATAGIKDAEDFPTMQRDAWYNVVIHGFTLTSALGRKHMPDLTILAKYTKPLVAEDRADRLGSDVDLNMILRRGIDSESLSKQKTDLAKIFPRCESEVRSLSYPEVIFLQTAYTVENLRASAGDCSTILTYFTDPQLRGGSLGNCLVSVALEATDRFLSQVLSSDKETFSAPFVAQQLAKIFEGCCHHNSRVQQAAYQSAERIMTQIPSALCQRSSLFALLDLLTLMWASCLDADVDEYEWKTTYVSPNGSTSIHLSDDFDLRRMALRDFQQKARDWVVRALNVAAIDVKGLLQTYLSESGENETVGHVSLGRSFALEMGSFIPLSDQRLRALDGEKDLSISTASDFVTQYTTREEYRATDPLSFQRITDGSSCRSEIFSRPKEDRTLFLESSITGDLRSIESRINQRQSVSWAETQSALRKAAALLCRSAGTTSEVTAPFVKIPFALFTKKSIKLGILLWLGVINENPHTEPRLVTEIIENLIDSANRGLGMFSPHLEHIDPFYIEEEFAPSDRNLIAKEQRQVTNSLAPHFHLFQFLASHFSSSRLGCKSTDRQYLRLMRVTLQSIKRAPGHPLARELIFHIILLSLIVFRYSTYLNIPSRWRLKDDIISAALGWFAHPPRWSYGGNRLQIKAETQLLADVLSALQTVSAVGIQPVSSSLKSLQAKQQLLDILIQNEQTRLMVWLFPLDHPRRHYLASAYHGRASSDASISHYLNVAWSESPSLTINLSARFHSSKLSHEIRSLILECPRVALNEAEGIRLLLGAALPSDVSAQLKYLMIWAPVNPITAVTFFLPAYGNHPSVIQYAVKALESNSVDVTFFYVPQIVQTLRYDTLGYVEQYIIETAKFSQLFAHQIIWNMKANSYKDEDSQEPDPVKPALDKVMDSLISSFLPDDRDFYEREFSFFGKITGVSGKLRPFLKATKPEKKQKIEEELRQIKLDIGVYLPSNPDGVVIGIDRKSGKPLQSHAKTPYMATFRIRKEKQEDTEDRSKEERRALTNGDITSTKSFEIWQSAIFKVGDDCRQDVLALQMITAFRGIFHHVGLPVYVFPYRVTVTAPGCGVIDVLPRSISRDMLGREAVNGLYEWFVSRFGSEEGPEFQAARANFVKSLAAYSIISYLLQFKDRHNGNIMFDDDGHILHVDFGFCFDIAPGGVRFERAPFKLTKEMVAVMGHSPDSQSFRWFEELSVKAFLASRQYVEPLAHIVVCMLDSGLPCFKPETIQHFKERFVLDKSEREAAEFVRFLIKKSYANFSTKGYDMFQLATNGIPY